MPEPDATGRTRALDREDGDVRASDAEREQMGAILSEAAGEGRLDTGELEARLERAYRARTRTELQALARDLPVGLPPRAPVADRGSRRQELRTHATAFVLVNLILVAIWAASGAGYFWPVWPLLGWGIGLVKHWMRTAPSRTPSRGCARLSPQDRSRLGDA